MTTIQKVTCNVQSADEVTAKQARGKDNRRTTWIKVDG
jgi:hypothetical protein